MTNRDSNNAIIQRRRKNGRDERVKNTASARNAKPKTVTIKTGGRSTLLRTARLDGRTWMGKALATYKDALAGHIGTDLSVPQALLIDQAARLQLLVGLAEAELNRAPTFDKSGSLAPAFDALIRSQRELRVVLIVLGLERKQKDVPALHEYLAQRHDHEDRADE